MSQPTATPFPSTPERDREEAFAHVRQALETLRFGQVGITVHEGRIVQIDITEKRRLPNR